MLKKTNLIFIILFCVYLSACSTLKTEKIKESDFITGFVMDENRNPVPDYGISIYLNNEKRNTFFTDSKGMFCIKEPVKGVVTVKGEKKGYSKIKEDKKKQFSSKNESILFYQVCSAENAFDLAEKYILHEEFDKAREVLKEICCEVNSPLGECRSFYLKRITSLEKKIKREKKNLEKSE